MSIVSIKITPQGGLELLFSSGIVEVIPKEDLSTLYATLINWKTVLDRESNNVIVSSSHEVLECSVESCGKVVWKPPR